MAIDFMSLALEVAKASKDPSTKVGAVIVDQKNRIVSIGYNGFARGVNDTEERLNDRELKYPLTIHAEENAILFAKRDLEGCTIYCTLFPCASCASKIVQTGIKKVVAMHADNPRFAKSFELSRAVFDECGVEITLLQTEADGLPCNCSSASVRPDAGHGQRLCDLLPTLS